jgi:DNA-binding beta-propeller fold protein YncE
MNFIKISLFIAIACLSFNCSEGQKSDKNIQEQNEKKGNKKKDKENNDKKDNGKKDDKTTDKELNFVDYSHIAIIRQWELPPVLKEISGICWFEKDKLAAVQDESGIIYIYNLEQGKIEREIPFGANGDYEAITQTTDAFYVLRVDGTVIKVPKDGTKTREYDTFLEAKDDTEGICYDRKNQRLLISLKASADSLNGIKNVYAFNLINNSLSKDPVFRINTKDTLFITGNKKKDLFQPSEISIHPVTAELYLTGGTNSSLLLLTNSGKLHYYTLLNPSEFEQPEGIAISPSGELFIATEGVKNNAKIYQTELVNKK